MRRRLPTASLLRPGPRAPQEQQAAPARAAVARPLDRAVHPHGAGARIAGGRRVAAPLRALFVRDLTRRRHALAPPSGLASEPWPGGARAESKVPERPKLPGVPSAARYRQPADGAVAPVQLP